MQLGRHFGACQRTLNIDWEATWYSSSAEKRVDSEVSRGPPAVPLLARFQGIPSGPARSGLGQPEEKGAWHDIDDASAFTDGIAFSGPSL